MEKRPTQLDIAREQAKKESYIKEQQRIIDELAKKSNELQSIYSRSQLDDLESLEMRNGQGIFNSMNYYMNELREKSKKESLNQYSYSLKKKGDLAAKSSRTPQKIDWKLLENTGKLMEGESAIAKTRVSIDEILKNDLQLLRGRCSVQYIDQPFSQGTFNCAFPGLIKDLQVKVVLKRPIEQEKYSEKQIQQQYQQELKKNAIVVCLSQDYNKQTENFSFWAKICFVNVFIYECKGKSFLLEGFLEGEYQKYSNNYDQLVLNQETRHLTAFAHFSYQHTNGRYLITDFQGINGYLLTDPAVHSKNGEFKSSGDLGEAGMRQFFSRHQCNDICRALNLTKVTNLVLDNSIRKWQELVFHHDRKSFKQKCSSFLCNKPSDSNDVCQECLIKIKEGQKQQQCTICKNNFNYSEYYYFIMGLFCPKMCKKCKVLERKVCEVCEGRKKSSNGKPCNQCEEKGFTNNLECQKCHGRKKIRHTCNKCDDDGQVHQECLKCTGSGKIKSEGNCNKCRAGTITLKCIRCEGSGTKRFDCKKCDNGMFTLQQKNLDCLKCSGTGFKLHFTCNKCAGSGHYTVPQKQLTCSKCNGDGYRDVECDKCDGSGQFEQDCNKCSGNGRYSKTYDCKRCEGKGNVSFECNKCDGTTHYETDCHYCE